MDPRPANEGDRSPNVAALRAQWETRKATAAGLSGSARTGAKAAPASLPKSENEMQTL